MKVRSCILISILFLSFTPLAKATETNSSDASRSSSSDDEYERRIKALSKVFDFRFTALVKQRITAQSLKGRGTTERMLGLSKLYFPIFEQVLRQMEMPDELKFIPLIESQLNPKALSYAGAGGLWQIVPSTATMYGLRINGFVDERLCSYRSTEIAVKLFKNLYKHYGDWGIALAAYNCGQVKVNSALRSTGSKDYWTVSQHLPRETQNYMPNFIAAAYIATFYDAHNIIPSEINQDYLSVDSIMVYENSSLSEIAEKAGISYETIKFLNPAFLKSVVPASKQGYVVVLPTSAKAKYFGFDTPVEYAGTKLVDAANTMLEEANVKFYHVATQGQTLGDVAISYQVPLDSLIAWNHLPANDILPEGLKIAFKADLTKKAESKEVVKEEEIAKSNIELNVLNIIKAKAIANYTPSAPKNSLAAAPTAFSVKRFMEIRMANLFNIPEHSVFGNDNYVYYEVQPGDNAWKIAKLYPDTTPKDIVSLNGFEKINNLKVGDMIKVLKLK